MRGRLSDREDLSWPHLRRRPPVRTRRSRVTPAQADPVAFLDRPPVPKANACRDGWQLLARRRCSKQRLRDTRLVSGSFVVTGGGRGVGRAIVERLISDGNSVAVLELERSALAWLDP